MISRISPLPLYFQLKEFIKNEIEAGRWSIGDLIPPEREFEDRFGLSRTTIRQALGELEHEGLLYRIQGKGTFVSEPKIETSLARMMSFTEEMTERGVVPGAKLLEFEEIALPPTYAKLMKAAPSEKVIRIERARLADDQPVALQVSYVRGVFGLQLDRTYFERGGSLYAALEQQGFRLSGAEETLQAVLAGEREAHLLGIDVGAPLFLMERLWHLADGNILGYGRMLYRGDRYKYYSWVPR
jgi:GntR family transcriptional regulator